MARSERVAVGDVVIGGKYRVERLLGEGGMGVVVLARHVALGQAVAIKVLRDDSDDAVVKRFMREAHAAAVQLEGDHVVRVRDVGRLENGAPYMLMDYLDGEDLGAIVTRGALRIEEAADYVLQACEGIAEAHALGIVHRDIKPQNLFLARRSHQRPIIKVLDFGIAKSFTGMDDVSLTAANTIMGSPAYMSPQQMRASRDVDSRTDVWSLGVVLYELLTGALPFEGHTVADLCASVLMQEPVAIDQRRADIPVAIQRVIERCLKKEVGERLSSVADLAGVLEAFAPPSARGTAERVARMLRSRRTDHEAPAQSSERTLPDRGRIQVAPAPALLPTQVAGGSAEAPSAHVRTAATFESLGNPSRVTRGRRAGRVVALATLIVGLALGLFGTVTFLGHRSSDPTATVDPPSARPVVVAPAAASSPVATPVSPAEPDGSAPAGPAEVAGEVDASVEAGMPGPKPRRVPVARPALPKSDAGVNPNAAFF